MQMRRGGGRLIEEEEGKGRDKEKKSRGWVWCEEPSTERAVQDAFQTTARLGHPWRGDIM